MKIELNMKLDVTVEDIIKLIHEVPDLTTTIGDIAAVAQQVVQSTSAEPSAEEFPEGTFDAE